MMRRLLLAAAMVVAVVLAAGAHGDEDDAVNGCYEGGHQDNCHYDGEPGSGCPSGQEWIDGACRKVGGSDELDEIKYGGGKKTPVGDQPPGMITVRITWGF